MSLVIDVSVNRKVYLGTLTIQRLHVVSKINKYLIKYISYNDMGFTLKDVKYEYTQSTRPLYVNHHYEDGWLILALKALSKFHKTKFKFTVCPVCGAKQL